MLEDEEADAELTERELQKAGIEYVLTRVETRSTYLQALIDLEPDLIISDYSLPTYDGLKALDLTLQRFPLIPFIFVSGGLGEERAIEALKSGATDYVMKSRLARLVPVVERAMKESKARRERRQMEIALVESEQRFRDVAEASSDMVWETDVYDEYTFISDGLDKISRHETGEIIGHTPWEVYEDAVTSSGADAIKQAMQNHMSFRDLESSLTYRSGTTVHWSTSGKPVYGLEGDFIGYRGASRDIRKRKETEEQLRRAQRLEAVGQLTGGIAHDFNNLLLALQLNLETLGMGTQDGPGREGSVDAALRIIGQGAELVKRLLAFSRKQELNAEPVDLNKRIEGMLLLLTRSLGAETELKSVLQEDILHAQVDASQFENALLNLCINARDAMPDGGELIIESSNVYLEQSSVEGLDDVKSGQYVLVAVSDSGTGMSEDVSKHAFEPFFTTKDIGKGSGLGLSMIFGFVKQSKGLIKIDSEIGRGTTIKMYFPRAHTTAEDEPDTIISD